MTERRTEENVPVRKLWVHVDECAAERKSEHQALKGAFDCHIDERHDTPLRALEGTGLTAADLVESAIEMRLVIPAMADVFFGPAKLDPITQEPLVDGNGHVLRHTEKGAQYAVHNGGFKASLPWGKLSVAFVTQFGLIIAAIIMTGGSP